MARWTITIAAIAAFVLAATYAIGGRELVARLLQMRSRTAATIQESLQPPTAAQLQQAARDAAARDTASVLPETGPRSASAALITVTIVVILGTAVATFYLTGRRGPRR